MTPDSATKAEGACARCGGSGTWHYGPFNWHSTPCPDCWMLKEARSRADASHDPKNDRAYQLRHAVSTLVKCVEQQDARIAELEREVADLRAVLAVGAALATSPTPSDDPKPA
jgi:hypothetical protein